MSKPVDQLRYNHDKPRLSYLYANYLALHRFDEHFSNADGGASRVLESTSLFLARGWPGDGWAPLVDACTALLVLIERDHDSTWESQTEHAYTFLAHCEHAQDAYGRLSLAGERKYERGNYRKGLPVTHYLDSFLRHLNAYLRGEAHDAETEAGHLVAAFWNGWQALNQPKWRDDRLPAVQGPPTPTLTIEDAYPRPATVPGAVYA